MAKLIHLKKDELVIQDGYLTDEDGNILVYNNHGKIRRQWDAFKTLCEQADFLADQPDHAEWPSLDNWKPLPDVDMGVPYVPLDREDAEIIATAEADEFDNALLRSARYAELKNAKLNLSIEQDFPDLARFIHAEELAFVQDELAVSTKLTPYMLSISWGEFVQTLQYCIDQMCRVKDGDLWLMGKTQATTQATEVPKDLTELEW